MNPVTPLIVLDAVLKYGPSVVSIIGHLGTAIAAGKGNQPLTDADWAELNRLSAQSAADIYAKLGIAAPK